MKRSVGQWLAVGLLTPALAAGAAAGETVDVTWDGGAPGALWSSSGNWWPIIVPDNTSELGFRVHLGDDPTNDRDVWLDMDVEVDLLLLDDDYTLHIDGRQLRTHAADIAGTVRLVDGGAWWIGALDVGPAATVHGAGRVAVPLAHVDGPSPVFDPDALFDADAPLDLSANGPLELGAAGQPAEAHFLLSDQSAALPGQVTLHGGELRTVGTPTLGFYGSGVDAPVDDWSITGHGSILAAIESTATGTGSVQATGGTLVLGDPAAPTLPTLDAADVHLDAGAATLHVHHHLALQGGGITVGTGLAELHGWAELDDSDVNIADGTLHAHDTLTLNGDTSASLAGGHLVADAGLSLHDDAVVTGHGVIFGTIDDQTPGQAGLVGDGDLDISTHGPLAVGDGDVTLLAGGLWMDMPDTVTLAGGTLAASEAERAMLFGAFGPSGYTAFTLTGHGVVEPAVVTQGIDDGLIAAQGGDLDVASAWPEVQTSLSNTRLDAGDHTLTFHSYASLLGDTVLAVGQGRLELVSGVGHEGNGAIELAGGAIVVGEHEAATLAGMGVTGHGTLRGRREVDQLPDWPSVGEGGVEGSLAPWADAVELDHASMTFYSETPVELEQGATLDRGVLMAPGGFVLTGDATIAGQGLIYGEVDDQTGGAGGLIATGASPWPSNDPVVHLRDGTVTILADQTVRPMLTSDQPVDAELHAPAGMEMWAVVGNAQGTVRVHGGEFVDLGTAVMLGGIDFIFADEMHIGEFEVVSGASLTFEEEVRLDRAHIHGDVHAETRLTGTGVVYGELTGEIDPDEPFDRDLGLAWLRDAEQVRLISDGDATLGQTPTFDGQAIHVHGREGQTPTLSSAPGGGLRGDFSVHAMVDGLHVAPESFDGAGNDVHIGLPGVEGAVRNLHADLRGLSDGRDPARLTLHSADQAELHLVDNVRRTVVNAENGILLKDIAGLALLADFRAVVQGAPGLGLTGLDDYFDFAAFDAVEFTEPTQYRGLLVRGIDGDPGYIGTDAILRIVVAAPNGLVLREQDVWDVDLPDTGHAGGGIAGDVHVQGRMHGPALAHYGRMSGDGQVDVDDVHIVEGVEHEFLISPAVSLFELDGPIVITGGGISPGDDHAPGKLSFGGNVTMQPDTTLAVRLDGDERGTGYDAIDVAGTLTLEAMVGLDVSADASLELDPFQSFVIAQAGAVAGQFAGLDEGDVAASVGGTDLTIHYADDAIELVAAGLVGDMNLDGVVDTADVAPFVQALTDPQAYMDQHNVDEARMTRLGDINGDGVLDTADVAPFVQLLVGDGAPVPEPGTGALLSLAGLIALRRGRAAGRWK